MKILMNTGGIASTNCFVLADENTKQAAFFDAPDHTTAPLLDQIDKRGWSLTALYLTHGHFDHIAEHDLITTRFPAARVYLHALDAPKLRDPHALPFPLPFQIASRDPDELLTDGQEIYIGSMQGRVIHTPGHSPGHVAFYFAEQNVIVGGDLIICGSVGRTDLPDSDVQMLNTSVRKIVALPPTTRLLPGHCQRSTIADELETNAYVKALVAGLD